MNTVTQESYRTHPELAFRLHAAARRDRARAIARLVFRLLERFKLRRPQALSLRWG